MNPTEHVPSQEAAHPESLSHEGLLAHEADVKKILEEVYRQNSYKIHSMEEQAGERPLTRTQEEIAGLKKENDIIRKIFPDISPVYH